VIFLLEEVWNSRRSGLHHLKRRKRGGSLQESLSVIFCDLSFDF